MALEEEVMKQQPAAQEQADPETGELNEEEEADLRIALTLSKNIIDDGGIEVIDEALRSSKDPAQVIGQFLMQVVSQMSEELPKELSLSPRVFLAEGGWVEQISDYLQEDYNVPEDVMDRAEMFVAAQADSMAQGGAQQATQTGDPMMQQSLEGVVAQQGGAV